MLQPMQRRIAPPPAGPGLTRIGMVSARSTPATVAWIPERSTRTQSTRPRNP